MAACNQFEQYENQSSFCIAWAVDGFLVRRAKQSQLVERKLNS
jgi:hypothetical protein